REMTWAMPSMVEDIPVTVVVEDILVTVVVEDTPVAVEATEEGIAATVAVAVDMVAGAGVALLPMKLLQYKLKICLTT
ncbi:hypothetical protein PIB30_099370, partial [Stylosanthes scabra]|nr:hypothetical protein [Stylosanthes scabra]